MRLLMEFLQPILTVVLSTPKPTQLIDGTLWVFMASSIFATIPSAVDKDGMHISKNWGVQMLQRLTSKSRTVSGFIFSFPESLDPSIAKENGLLLMWSSKCCWKKGATAPLIIQAVFVLFDEKFFASSLSENTSWNNDVSSSAKARKFYAVQTS